MRICPAPACSSARRRVRMSSAPRTKGSITPVTPQVPASCRFCRSSSVNVGGGHRQPRCRKAFCGFAGGRPVPQYTAGQRHRFRPPAQGACRRPAGGSGPAGLHAPAPPGRGHPLPQPEALAWFQHKGLGQRANAQLRPLRSMSSWGMPTAWMISSQSLWAERGPWERFMRMPVMPAFTMRCKVSSWAQAGPMVP